jgi:hypothetical protein
MSDVPNATIWKLAKETGTKITVTFPSSEYDRLSKVIGSLVISQFDDQDAYRAVISEMFEGWVDNGELSDA